MPLLRKKKDLATVVKSAVNYTLWGEGRGWGAGGEGVGSWRGGGGELEGRGYLNSLTMPLLSKKSSVV